MCKDKMPSSGCCGVMSALGLEKKYKEKLFICLFIFKLSTFCFTKLDVEELQ